jgi:tetratricopeptide (TPR) repeat protein
MGICYEQTGETDKAIANYEKSIKLNDKFFSSRYCVAMLYAQNLNNKQAIKHLEACLNLEPLYWTVLSDFGIQIIADDFRVLLGSLYIADKQYEKAVSTLKEAIDKYGQRDPKARLLLGQAYYFANKKDDACKVFKELVDLFEKLMRIHEKVNMFDIQALGLTPEYERPSKCLDILNPIAEFFMEMGKFDEAEKTLSLADKFATLGNIKSAGIHARRAMICAKKNDKASAEAEIKKMAEADPKCDAEMGELAVYFKREGKLELAETCYKKAVEINPRNTANLFNFGCLYYKMKNYVKALEMFEKALAVDPDFEEAKEWAKKAREKLNK